jgi:hypothetical protein
MKEQAQVNPLIKNESGYVYVMVSHNELDNLVARMMHLAELDSDKEHREALKGELKQISRNWLDNLYEESGYHNHNYDSAKVITIPNTK